MQADSCGIRLGMTWIDILQRLCIYGLNTACAVHHVATATPMIRCPQVEVFKVRSAEEAKKKMKRRKKRKREKKQKVRRRGGGDVLAMLKRPSRCSRCLWPAV